MVNNINTNLFSLIGLSIFIITYLSWLVSKTLKEGREALKEMNNDST